MSERWRLDRFKLRIAMMLAVLSIFNHNLSLCWSLNSEGLALLRFRERVMRDPFGALSNWNDHNGDINPCFWFGVQCSDGKVVILNLKDLCLGGTLAPELGKLTYIKSIILRNNSFSGTIPQEVGELKELEVLDLGHNNFSGPFPSDLGNNLSLSILLLDDNKFLGSISPELYKLKMLSEFQVDENQLTSAALGASCNSRSSIWKPGDIVQRRLLQVADAPHSPKAERNKHNRRSSKSSPSPFLSSSPSPSPSPSLLSSSLPPSDSPLTPFIPPSTSISSTPESPLFSPSDSLPPSPSPILPPSPASLAPANPPIVDSKPPESHPAPFPSPASTPSPIIENGSKSNHHMVLIWSLVIGVSLVIFVSALGIFFCRSKVVTVKPWTTGLSGQLQKAFVTDKRLPSWTESSKLPACVAHIKFKTLSS
ncbi:hypothetical protein F0562_001131, partial [Nyssa sinensis]